ncbi:glycosyltransferase family 2 protein [Streptococcus himalayensis]|uniref:Glycosyl transferase family 2 n=1 Tax=Streptococcus himalayensis TaxID=1888195 RepID=A0A917A4M9_9STRE|nr:glycosyltransferase family 2 protein [Streptococcus himalayensis]GGE24865.1 glycosyl transferase family 2 [Streptococcus himalayensis]
MDDLVSVVITTYGRTDTLRRAIQSVLNQTHQNMEILVVDDNKETDLKAKVRELVEGIKDARLKLIVNEVNVGGAVARNVGIANSKADYIAFLDDDDEYLPIKIEKQLELFKNSSDKVGLIYGYCLSIDSQGHEVKYTYDYTGKCVFEGMLDCIAATSQWMCRKEALDSVGCFSDVPCKQDSTVIVKLLAAGYEVDRVPEFLSIYHDEESQRISRQGHEKRIIGEEKLRDLCRSHYDLLSERERKEVEYRFACRLAPHYYATKDFVHFKSALKNILTTHLFKRTSLSFYKQFIRYMVK